MMHGAAEDGRDVFDLEFALPSICADHLSSGEAAIGIVPVIEMARQKLEYFRGTGIACHGAVRSILLISKVPFREIRTLAADSGSRTSVMLSRVILAEKFGVQPHIVSMAADLAPMLGVADAALLIGDAALRVDPANLPFETLDLGFEWTSLTGLPMVFALWSGRKDIMDPRYGRAFLASCRFGLGHLDDIVSSRVGCAAIPGGDGAKISDRAYRLRIGSSAIIKAWNCFCNARPASRRSMCPRGYRHDDARGSNRPVSQ